MLVSLDTETNLIQAYRFTPDLVCVSYSIEGGPSGLYHRLEREDLLEFLTEALTEPDYIIVGANIAYDMRVLCNYAPELFPLVWDAYEAGRIQDVILREKLYALSTTGDLKFRQLPGGNRAARIWSLADVELDHLPVNRMAEKKDKTGWRLRYGELIDTPISEWPVEAVDYAVEDAKNPLEIYLSQEALRKPMGRHGSIETGWLHSSADFALGIFASWGIATDPERVEALGVVLERVLHPDRMKPLYDAGIVRPASPPRPYKNGSGKSTAGKPESKNKKKLCALVEKTCKRLMIPIKHTKSGQISADADVIQQIINADTDPKSVFRLFQERESLVKLRSTYLPVLQADRVWFPYNVLVSSGRTSSRSDDNLPSTNGQNQPRIDGEFSTRECFVADPDWIFASVDYSMIELCSLAQTNINLFGSSTHAELINAGADLHAYLGAQLAFHLDDRFRAKCDARKFKTGGDVYKAFLELKQGPPKNAAFFKHWRTFAKPVGLGYPGGLGEKTFVEFARTSYGIEVDLETASLFRKIWFQTHPDMRAYFDWVSGQIDDRNVWKDPDDPNKTGRLYRYTSPHGMTRSGAKFTEAANGFALQTPTAELAKLSVIRIARACTDPTVDSILYGCHPVLFIHDENIVAIPDDEGRHDRAMAIVDDMLPCARSVLPDVRVTAEPALMRRWSKLAEPVYDGDGRLVVWEPTT